MKSKSNEDGYSGSFLNITLAILIFGIFITAINIFQLQKMLQENEILKQKDETPLVCKPCTFQHDGNHKHTVWIHGKQLESGYLEHVFKVFGRLGYKTFTTNPPMDWNVLWTHEYPFTELTNQLAILQPFQKVNHFPGCGFITNKVSLSTSAMKYIPKAFKLPADKDRFMEHASLNPDKIWVQKSNSHRGIQVEKIDSSKLDSEGTFLQEFVHNPLLIDGRKFDIGIYSILTSIEPLRVYVYDGDALLRFCPEPYHPFNETNIDSYVVGDDYLPIWKMPSLDKLFTQQSLTMKESLNSYLRTQGKDPNKIWFQIKDAIANVYIEKEMSLVKAANKFTSTRHFFEMVRFDFVVDEDLNVYLLENYQFMH